MSTSNKKSARVQPKKKTLLNNIFDIDEIKETPKPKKKLVMKYNQAVYFDNPKDAPSASNRRAYENSKNKDDFLNKVISEVKNIKVPTTRQNFWNNNSSTRDTMSSTLSPKENNLRSKKKIMNSEQKAKKEEDDSDIVENDEYDTNESSNNTKSYKNKINKSETMVRIPVKKNGFNNTINTTSTRRYLNPNNKSNTTANIFHKKEDPIILSIACMNCGNSIPIDEVEEHSRVCVKVTEEVKRNDSSQYQVYNINFKLNKLSEYVASLNSEKTNLPANINKEIKCISLMLLEYIKSTLNIETINADSIQSLRKNLQNLEVLAKPNFNISSLILIDRAKVLISEKLKVFKDYYKMQISTQRANEAKTGTLEMGEMIKEKKKELEKINIEAELERTKVKNLRKSATPLTKPANLKSIVDQANKINKGRLTNTLSREELNLQTIVPIEKGHERNNILITSTGNLEEEIKKLNSGNTIDSTEEKMLKNELNANFIEDELNRIENHNNMQEQKLEEIHSDVENNNSQGLSFNTSVSNLSSYREEEFKNDAYNILRGGRQTDNHKDYRDTNFLGIKSNNEGTFNSDIRMNKQIFYNIIFKTKFEKLHGSHPGQKINPAAIYKECIRLKVPKDKWDNFVLAELNNPNKYLNAKKQGKHFMQPTMGVIAEER